MESKVDSELLMKLVEMKLSNPKKYKEYLKAIAEVTKDMSKLLTEALTEVYKL